MIARKAVVDPLEHLTCHGFNGRRSMTERKAVAEPVELFACHWFAAAA
jgi:hypothetical protein